MVVNYLGSEAGAREVVAEASRLGTEAIALRGDVARDDDVRRLIGATLDHFGLQVPEDQCRRMVDINVMGTLLCSRYALPPMIERKGGRIIESLTRALASEIGPHGITVNAIAT